MRTRTFVASLIALPALSACIYIDAEDSGGFHVATQFGLPDLKSVDIGETDVTIRMPSNGCTNKDTVEASVDQDGKNEYEVAFDRIKDDNCRAYFPNGIELTWSYDELGIPEGTYVRVLNDIAG